MRNIRTTQDVEVSASRRYKDPIQWPAYSFPSPATGDESPPWSPGFDVIINTLTVTGSPSTASTDPVVLFLLKRNAFSVADPIFVGDVTLGPNTFRGDKNLQYSYGIDRLVTPADALYVGVWSGDGASFNFISVQAYGERYRPL